MKLKLSTKLLILACLLCMWSGISHAQQINNLDVLPNTNSTDSTAVLNNTLRLNQNAINTIGGYFNSNNQLTIAAGGTGASTAQGAINNLLAPSVQGEIIYFDGTNWSHLAPGTSGYLLASQGAGANPHYIAPTTTPALVWVSTTTVSATTTTGNIPITSGNTYFVQYNFTNFTGPGNLSVRFNADSGAHYKYIYSGAKGTGTATNGGSASDTHIKLSVSGVSQTSPNGINGHFYIQQVGSSTQVYRIWGQNLQENSTDGFEILQNAGSWSNSANATSFSMVEINSNNMTGNVYLYQVVNQ